MNAHLSKFSLSLVAASMLAAPLAFAGESDTTAGIKKALSDSKVSLSFRARYEGVDDDGADDRADALTVLSRMTINTGSFNGLSLGLEVDNVTALVDNYNDLTFDYSGNEAVVADPEITDINQAFAKYTNGAFVATVGRQRIVHNNQRFVGGVAWRQNEQTYDGVRAEYKVSDAFSLDYSYIHNANRIFADDKKGDDLKGDFHFINAPFKINKDHKITAFAYLLDFETANALSSDTFGALYNGNFGGFNVNASYASQSDTGGNTNNYSADYINLEASTKAGKVTLLGGYELLGSDNGVGFSTPFATLHKFNGFADKFLSTPADGIEDIYVTVKGAVSGVKLSATYHDLSSDVGGKDWGNELDLVAAYKIDKNYNVLVKFASYSGDMPNTDANKLWLQLAAKF